VGSVMQWKNPIARQFLGCRNLDEGKAFALLPSGPLGDPYAFEESIVRNNPAPKIPIDGGGVLQAVGSTDAFLHRWLASLFRADDTLALACESYVLCKPTRGAKSVARMLALGDFAALLAVAGDGDDVMDACVGTIGAVPPGWGFLFAAGENASDWASRATLTDAELERKIAQETAALLMGAYDGDSFLIWVPAESTLEIPPFLEIAEED
ncbi:MAG: hypothetical protein ABW133_20525, partial [Polyangiaceae bacterium]